MSGEVYDGQDAGYVPENPEFPQNHSHEHDGGNVIDDTGFPQLQPDEQDGGNLAEDADHPKNNFDGDEIEGLPENPDFPLQENAEEQHGGGDEPENFGSEEKQGSEKELKGSEIKKWPGWPGHNIFRMLVPVQKVGSIIGLKGKNIKHITEETKARIKVLDGRPGTSERAVVISAREEPDRKIPPAVDGLLRVHKLVFNVGPHAADSTSGAGHQIVTRLLVADTQAASLIGKRGSILKSFKDATGCNILVLRSEHLPIFALRHDCVVEIQGEFSGVHKTVELIATHLRIFLVDQGIVGVLEAQMQMSDVRPYHNLPPGPPHQPWGPPQGFPAPGPGSGGGPDFPPNPMGIYQSSVQPQQSIVTKVTQRMQIPLSYAYAVIGALGSNISYIRRASGASITIQETRGVPGEMTAEISGTASETQAAQQLVQNSMAVAAASAGTWQDHMGGSINQAYGSNYGFR